MSKQTHIFERDSDKALFEQIDMSMIEGDETVFVFRRLKEIPQKAWWITPRLERTEEIWKSNGGDFTVVESDYIVIEEKNE